MCIILELICYDLRNPDEWNQFYSLFSSYLAEVCDKEEYQENIDDLHNEELNRQMIDQTLQYHNPYFVMRIMLNSKCIGIISYSYNEERRYGFINNFYICPEYRNVGIGSSVYRMVEAQLRSRGAMLIELIPVKKALNFYACNGFIQSCTTIDGVQAYRKIII